MENVVTTTIPLPRAAGRKGGGRVKYPFDEMGVEASFYTSSPPERVGPAARQYGKRHGVRFTVRAEGRGARVWRIA